MALTDAQTAMRAAMTAQTDAKDAMKEAVADAAAELKIAGMVKSVGDTMIDAAASSSVVTTDGTTVDTGLQSNDLLPDHHGPRDDDHGVHGAVRTKYGWTDTVVAYSGARRQVWWHVCSDSSSVRRSTTADDMARLMIITQYAGTDTVKVYASTGADDEMGTKSGYISIDDTDTNDVVETNNVRLRSAGAYYFAQDTAALSDQASIAADAEAQHVYSYVSMADDPDTADVDETVISYLVLKTESTVTAAGDTTTTYTYSDVAIHVMVDVNGDGDDQNVEVTAKIPEATGYDHIHFGVWAALGDAEKDGTQEIDDLGIGFVQNFSGSGMSGADMPNNGDATYTGNWVATVQEADDDGDGDITLVNGAATIAADFGDGDIIATLTDLATLTGEIAGNQFSGSKAVATGSGLDRTADFEGSFSGAFYGTKGAEAGGVFDFASDDGDNEGGAFRGAFGGKK